MRMTGGMSVKLRVSVACAVVGVLSISSGPSWAVDLDVQGETDYKVTIEKGSGSSTSGTYYHNTIHRNVCSDECTINVEGVGSVKASGSSVVTLKDGQLTVR